MRTRKTPSNWRLVVVMLVIVVALVVAFIAGFRGQTRHYPGESADRAGQPVKR